jgi:hypothetical protein
MNARLWIACACTLLIGSACETSNRFDDAGTGPADGGEPNVDGGPSDNGSGSRFGAACERTSDCGRNLFCDQEIDQSYDAENLPSGTPNVLQKVFPGGMCTPLPAAVYDPSGVESCDPLGPPAHQGCGQDGQCVVVGIDGETWVSCRPLCEPSATESGCGRRSYTCDFDLGACVEGCQSDDECRLQLIDADGDGTADSLAYDDDSLAECDLDTYRCTLPGPATGATGDACERLDDCEPDGICVQPAQTFAGLPFPGGMCTKTGCNVEGRECSGDNATCERLRSWTPGLITAFSCLQSCTVGAEPEADRVGPNGHGEGCRDGYRCHYNGGNGAESGVCVGGNYNAVTENNMGSACETDADCYSPYGLGSCLLLSVGDVTAPTGSCSLMDCNIPGLPDDVCGDKGVCIGLNSDLTFCAQTCEEAEECADGYACTDEDGDPRTARICYPACLADEDCRKDVETCSLSPNSGVGACVASGP